jgi:hypothetical protein
MSLMSTSTAWSIEVSSSSLGILVQARSTLTWRRE